MQPNTPNPYYPPNGNMPAPMPQMPTNNGPVNNGNHGLPKDRHVGFIASIVVLALLAIGLAAFAFWAYGERQDYKDHSDQKVAVAVKATEKATTDKNNKQFAEELKNPLKNYVGPASYGTVTVAYPKTWSAYITANGNSLLDAYFNPDIVPSLQPAPGATLRQAIALHVEVINQPYDQVVLPYKGQIDAGKLTATAYALPKNPQQIGTKYTGTLLNQLQGTQIIVPLRDKTLSVTTESDAFLNDFNTYIAPNLSFIP
jgi:hypothetical protein